MNSAHFTKYIHPPAYKNRFFPESVTHGTTSQSWQTVWHYSKTPTPISLYCSRAHVESESGIVQRIGWAFKCRSTRLQTCLFRQQSCWNPGWLMEELNSLETVSYLMGVLGVKGLSCKITENSVFHTQTHTHTGSIHQQWSRVKRRPGLYVSTGPVSQSSRRRGETRSKHQCEPCFYWNCGIKCSSACVREKV